MRVNKKPLGGEEGSSEANSNNPSTTEPKPSASDNSDSNANSNSNSRSLGQRIRSSASGLIHNALKPHHSDTAAVAASASSNKLSGASSNQPSAAASNPTPFDSRYHSSTDNQTFHSTWDGSSNTQSQFFRSRWVTPSGLEEDFANHSPAAQEQFGHEYDMSPSKGKGRSDIQVYTTHHEGQQRLTPTEPYNFNHVWNAGKRTTTIANHEGLDGNHPPTTTITTTTSTTTVINHRGSPDGAAVASLLDDPSFQPLYEPDSDAHPNDTHDGPASLFTSPSQSTLAPPPSAASITPLSLVPDINTVLAEFGVMTNGQELRLAELPGVEEWLALDFQYHDVVWGNIRPFVESAKQEVDERRDRGEEGPGDGPAVRRLKAVLEHFQEQGVLRPRPA
ncbi:hypothetical protein FQN57_005979 [Myotisia sp. PD_48]|nr:hypothetical protein FQN57_005979 [Myotisia sp. PD_48]